MAKRTENINVSVGLYDDGFIRIVQDSDESLVASFTPEQAMSMSVILIGCAYDHDPKASEKMAALITTLCAKGAT